jgi:hypothetical protein
MNKLNVPSASCEISDILIIPMRADEHYVEPSLLCHCLLNSEQLSHGIFQSSVCEHVTHIRESENDCSCHLISIYEYVVEI